MLGTRNHLKLSLRNGDAVQANVLPLLLSRLCLLLAQACVGHSRKRFVRFPSLFPLCKQLHTDLSQSYTSSSSGHTSWQQRTCGQRRLLPLLCSCGMAAGSGACSTQPRQGLIYTTFDRLQLSVSSLLKLNPMVRLCLAISRCHSDEDAVVRAGTSSFHGHLSAER